MSGRLEGSAKAEWREHWPVVMASLFGVGLLTVYVYSTGIMIAPLEKEFGWSRAEISSGPTIVAVLGCIAAPFMGIAIDRFGARRIALAGVFLLCSALALLSQANASIWSWYALWFLVALAHPFIKPTVWTAAVSSLFSSGRGLALAVAFCGTGMGSGLVPILGHFLIENYGWRMAYVGLGGIWMLITLPMIYFFFYSAVDKQRVRKALDPGVAPSAILPGMAARDAFRSRPFYKLATATSLISMASVAITVNLVPILSGEGIARETAAFVAGSLGISGILGKLSGGWLIDRYDANKVVGLATACPAITCLILILMPGSIPAALAAVAILGLALGIEFDGVAYLASRHFGLRHFGLIFGTIAGALALTSGVGPVLANYGYDVTRSYWPLLWSGIPLSLVSGVLFWIMGPYPVFAAPVAGDAEPA